MKKSVKKILKNTVEFGKINYVYQSSLLSKETRGLVEKSCCKTKRKKITAHIVHSKKNGCIKIMNNEFEINKNNTIDIFQAARMLIRFFYMTGKERHCSRLLIEKMLSIAYLIALKEGRLLFDEVFSVNACGLGCPILSRLIPADIELEQDTEHKPTNKPFEFIKLDNYIIPEIFCGDDVKNQDDYSLLLNIFIQFGDCSPKFLGINIDSFKEEIASEKPEYEGKRVVDLYKAINFLRRPNLESYNSKVLNYIIEYGQKK